MTLLWWLLGRRYAIRDGVLQVRLRWFDRWQPVRVVKQALPFEISEELLDE